MENTDRQKISISSMSISHESVKRVYKIFDGGEIKQYLSNYYLTECLSDIDNSVNTIKFKFTRSGADYFLEVSYTKNNMLHSCFISLLKGYLSKSELTRAGLTDLGCKRLCNKLARILDTVIYIDVDGELKSVSCDEPLDLSLFEDYIELESKEHFDKAVSIEKLGVQNVVYIKTPYDKFRVYASKNDIDRLKSKLQDFLKEEMERLYASYGFYFFD